MAANLRAKLPDTDDVLVNDRNAEALENFAKEVAAANAGKPKTVEAFNSAREVAEKAVSKLLFPSALARDPFL